MIISNQQLPKQTDSDSCCSFPCQNGGICLRDGLNDYNCDCSGLSYYGKNCEVPTIWEQVKKWLRPSKDSLQYMLTHYPQIWNVVNNIKPLHQRIMKYIYISRANQIDTPPRYNSAHDYITIDSNFNSSFYARTLPPVPKHCPTPMGTAGKKQLPDVDKLIETLFTRQEFLPEPHNSNLLFAYYAQHFTHQFFRTNSKAGPGFTLGSEGVDLSHIYGNDVKTQQLLRHFTDGKLKYQIINDEMYPASIETTPVPNIYPENIPKDQRFALGHPFYGILPGLFAYATIWLREHNRVCDVLKSQHPTWDDERLFQTTRLIILGEMIKITIEEYVQHLSQYNLKLTFEPELVHGEAFQYSNRIRAEFVQLYHWHPLFPEEMNISGKFHSLQSVLYKVDTVLKNGLTSFIDSMVKEQAGALTHHNHPKILLPVLKTVIENGRKLRLQSFNQYRKRFSLEPYTSFIELTGNKKSGDVLEKLYTSIDAVEFYVGLLMEKPGASVTPTTMVEIGGPYSVKGLMSNPICSPEYWKPSTFGGEVGFNIVRKASLQKLICQNLKGPCPRISFKLLPDSESAMHHNEL